MKIPDLFLSSISNSQGASCHGKGCRRTRQKFFKDLFDDNFTNSITISILRFLFKLNVLIIGLIAVVALLSTVIMSFRIMSESAFAGLMSLIVGVAIIAFLALAAIVYNRVIFEYFAAIFRTAQNTSDLVRLSGGNPGEFQDQPAMPAQSAQPTPQAYPAPQAGAQASGFQASQPAYIPTPQQQVQQQMGSDWMKRN